MADVVADRLMAQFIEQNSWAPLKVLAVANVPRDAMAIVTVTGKSAEDRRRICASAAYAALQYDPDLKIALVRVVASEQVIFTADLTREKATLIHNAEPAKAAEVAEASLANEWNPDAK